MALRYIGCNSLVRTERTVPLDDTIVDYYCCNSLVRTERTAPVPDEVSAR